MLLFIILVWAWAMYSKIGMSVFDENSKIHVQADMAEMFGVGFIILCVAVLPIAASILFKYKYNKVLFFGITMINIFLVFALIMIFPVNMGFYI